MGANLAKLYPNIMQVLRLLLIIPVTSSGVERANSVLANRGKEYNGTGQAECTDTTVHTQRPSNRHWDGDRYLYQEAQAQNGFH